LRKRHDVQGHVPPCWPWTTWISISTILEQNSPALTRDSEADNLAMVTRKLLAGILRD
jgi:hypothetical protein